MSAETVHPIAPINRRDDPVIRCEFCRKIIGRIEPSGLEQGEVSPAKISLDPDFLAHRLFQFCAECREQYVGRRSDAEFIKNKWRAIDYQKQIEEGRL